MLSGLQNMNFKSNIHPCLEYVNFFKVRNLLRVQLWRTFGLMVGTLCKKNGWETGPTFLDKTSRGFCRAVGGQFKDKNLLPVSVRVVWVQALPFKISRLFVSVIGSNQLGWILLTLCESQLVACFNLNYRPLLRSSAFVNWIYDCSWGTISLRLGNDTNLPRI